jgi:type II secretory pathway pseudopilin PulG
MAPSRSQHGFSLVEALVAAFVLVAGALATVAMVSAANDQTARNLGEESATGLAREVGEVARHIAYTSVQDPDAAASAIAALVPGSGQPVGSTWVVSREARSFSVSLASCPILATEDGGCTTPAPGAGEGQSWADTAALLSLLGLAGVDLSQGATNALCGVFGPEFDLTTLSLDGVDAATCAQIGSQASLPSGPPRLARLTVTVAWDDRGRARQVEGTTLVVDPLSLASPT